MASQAQTHFLTLHQHQGSSVFLAGLRRLLAWDRGEAALTSMYCHTLASAPCRVDQADFTWVCLYQPTYTSCHLHRAAAAWKGLFLCITQLPKIGLREILTVRAAKREGVLPAGSSRYLFPLYSYTSPNPSSYTAPGPRQV